MPHRIRLSFVILSLIVFAVSCGKQAEQQETSQTPAAAKPAFAERMDQVIAPGDTLQKISGAIVFDTGGSPCWDNGTLFFTNNMFDPKENSRTYRMDPDGKVTVIRAYNGVTSSIHRTGRGTYYCCEMIGHQLVEMDRDGKVLRVVAGEYNGVRLDGPNDMVIDSKGGIYFTDARFSPGTELVQDKPAVYYVKPDGSLIRVLDDIVFPNGIDLSPDGTILYVINTRGEDKGRFVFAYDVQPDGTVANKRQFCEVAVTPQNESKPDGTSGADGCAVDSAGNLYVATTQGIGIQVFNPAGAHLGDIPCTAATNNCYFGGPDLMTLYVAAKDGIYSIRTQIKGVPDPM